MKKTPSFSIRRGTNISHWLSQSKQRGSARRAWFMQEDMNRIADWGFDHIRLPVDEQQMWNDFGEEESEAFDLMDSALDWAEEAGLKTIVDLHILRSHFFISAMEPRLFADPEEAQKFSDLWRQLSARLKRRANDRVAYELLNEAVATDPQDWNRVAMGAFQTLRNLEPDRTIVLGSNRWNSALTFDQLHVPDDKNTILTFHFYHPMLVTHHQAKWCPEGRMYDGPIQYPGQPIPGEHVGKARLPEDARLVQLKMEEVNKPYDRNSMVTDMTKPITAAKKNGMPLYCGEFGVINVAPQPVRVAWYHDIISVFNEYGIGWANWDYKGEFGIVEKKGQSTGIAEAMLSIL